MGAQNGVWPGGQPIQSLRSHAARCCRTSSCDSAETCRHSLRTRSARASGLTSSCSCPPPSPCLPARAGAGGHWACLSVCAHTAPPLLLLLSLPAAFRPSNENTSQSRTSQCRCTNKFVITGLPTGLLAGGDGTLAEMKHLLGYPILSPHNHGSSPTVRSYPPPDDRKFLPGTGASSTVPVELSMYM